MKQFKDRDTNRVLEGKHARRIPPEISRSARKKVQRVIAAGALSDLRRLPSHRLELLRGDRKGHHSIRINDQWRVCFRWTEQGAVEIEITDCH